MDIENSGFVREFIRMADDGWMLGWHERNGGNLSYRINEDDRYAIKEHLTMNGIWEPIGTDVPGLANEYFLVTGSGKYFRNIKDDPGNALGIIEIDDHGHSYRICWGFSGNGKPTSELPSHLMNHEVKKKATKNQHRVIYHAHATNTISLTFVLPLEDKVFTRTLWEAATECGVVFPSGVGIISWMVPGGQEIALKTSEKMKNYDVVIWAHHGVFCSGKSFDDTFGLMHTVEKAASITVKVLSMTDKPRQTITSDNFTDLADAFDVNLPKRFLNDDE